MISKGDDYPIHQTPEPVQQVFTSDRNFYDRFFFNGYFREGEPYFAAAMGISGVLVAAFGSAAYFAMAAIAATGVAIALAARRMWGEPRPT